MMRTHPLYRAGGGCYNRTVSKHTYGTCSECAEPARRGGRCLLHLYLSKIEKRGPGDCWPWTAHRNGKNYGMQADGNGGSMPAHRFGYLHLVGPLSPDDIVDHTCHNGSGCPGGNTCEHRPCQNPAHWEAVPSSVNGERGESFTARNARKTHCKWDHELTPENSYGYHGRRQCKTCAQLAARGEHPRQK